MGVAVSGLTFSGQIMSLYGGSYNADRWYLGTFLFAAVLAAAPQILGVLIIVSNRQWNWRASQIFIALMNQINAGL
jgi:hypothetical protein